MDMQTVITSAKSYLPHLDEERIQDAYIFARDAHGGQLRKDGTPYITHPVTAANILTGLRVDEDTLIACLLHDVPEDTACTLDDIEARFGKTVCFLVDGITKLSKVHYRNDMEERQIESLKKLFIHSARDPRIILIKLADRLHNMRTIDAIDKPEKRKRIAKETLEVFVPIANLLGIWQIKNEMEDLCFRTLKPRAFKEIDQFVKQSDRQKKGHLDQTMKQIQEVAVDKGIEINRIEGREKTYYSIYKKMYRTGKSFEEIHDLMGIRIILPNIADCYQMLGILHQTYTPKIGRLKDYIAIPKSNGYQGIHTTVFGHKGHITEFQIRSYDMHLENEYGIAAHYFYRESQDKEKKHIEEKLRKKYEWVQRILDIQRDIRSNKKFMKNLKLDIFEDRIFVFTPKGDVIDLPQGANVIDFAYHIHSDIGMLALEAKINGKTSSLMTKLSSSDVVQVITSENSEGPQVDWLDRVQTNLARGRIREYLKEKDKEALISEAEALLDEKLRLYSNRGTRDITDLQRILVLEELSMETWEDVLYEIGRGSMDVNEVISLIFTEKDLFGEEKDPYNECVYENKTNASKTKQGLGPKKKVHQIGIHMEIRDRLGLLGEISLFLGHMGINIIEMHSFTNKVTENYVLQFIIEIENMEHYKRALYGLKRIEGVVSISRLDSASATPADSIDAHTKPSRQ
jgi:guanosine-3',5'-bis(diphosphate) 3'-pyrophosphohydrolase